MGAAPQRAAAARSPHYARHRPEHTPLYRLVRERYETFAAEVAHAGAVTLIQRFGSAANLNIHLHALVLDGVYSTADEGAPVFIEAPALTDAQLQTLLDNIIRRSVRLLTRLGHLIEEAGVTYLARSGDIDPDNVLAPLQVAASTYRIAMGPRAGRKVLSLQNTSSVGWVKPITTNLTHPAKLCTNAQGFSLHAGVRCEANDRIGIEQLCRYITRPAISNERLSINREGNAVSNSRPRGAMAQRTLCSRRWNSCSGWRHWCPDHGCT